MSWSIGILVLKWGQWDGFFHPKNQVCYFIPYVQYHTSCVTFQNSLTVGHEDILLFSFIISEYLHMFTTARHVFLLQPNSCICNTIKKALLSLLIKETISYVYSLFSFKMLFYLFYSFFYFHVSFRINITKKHHLKYDWDYIEYFDQFG